MKTIKRKLAIVLAAAMLFSLVAMPVSADSSCTLSVSNAAVTVTDSQEQDVTVDVSISGLAPNTGWSGLTLYVYYDSDVMTYKTYSMGNTYRDARKKLLDEEGTVQLAVSAGQDAQDADGDGDRSEMCVGIASTATDKESNPAVMAGNGVLWHLTFTVAKGLESQELPLTIACLPGIIDGNEETPNTTDGKVTVKGVLPTIGDVSLTDNSVTVNGTVGASVDASVVSVKGTDITNSVSWSVSPSGSGVSIASNGKVTVGAKAEAGEYEITASSVSGKSQGEAQSAALIVERAEPEAKKIVVKKDGKEITGTDTVIIPTGNTTNSYTYTAGLLDQYDDDFEGDVTLGMTGDLASNYSNGTITLASSDTGLKDKNGTLTASYGSLAPVNVTITAKDIDITAPVVSPKKNPVYGDTWAQIVPQNAISGGSASLNGNRVQGSFYLKTEGKPNAGEQSFEVYFRSNNNEYDVLAYTGKVNVAKKDATITADSASKTYDGTALTKDSYNATGLISGDSVMAATVSGSVTNAGTADNEISEATISNGTDNVTANYNIKYVKGMLTVNKAKLTIKANDNTIIYGEAPANNGAAYEGLVNGENESVVSGLEYSYNYEQYGNAGEYRITVSGAVSSNYDISFAAGKLTVDKKEVGVTWSNYSDLYYDGNAKNVTAAATGTVNGDEITVTVAGGNRTKIGSYTAAASGLTGNKAGNYKLADVKPTQAYEIKAALTSVTADPATVTATVDNDTLTIKLVGYVSAGVTEVNIKNGDTVLDITADNTTEVNGVTYKVDGSAVVVNNTEAVITEKAALVIKDNDADETIDSIVDEVNVDATKSEGLASAAAGSLLAKAANDSEIKTIETMIGIALKSFTNDGSNASLKMRIDPIAFYIDENDEQIGDVDMLMSSDVKSPVTISVKLPAAMTADSLVVKSTVDGKTEYTNAAVIGGVAKWQQDKLSALSEIELTADSRSVSGTFTFADGSGQRFGYTASDIGAALPSDSKSGSRFKGWSFEGVEGTFTTLTDELLTALSGKTNIAATAQFSGGSSGGGGGGGAAKPEEPVQPTTPSAVENPFADVVKGEYYYDAVLWAVKSGITEGTSKTEFSPYMTCTRAQAVTFLWRAAGSPEPTSNANPFADVAVNAYYYKAVLWAVENGITTGTSDTAFDPDDTVTRAQIVTFLWRNANKPSMTSAAAFADVATTDYFYGAVAWAAEQKITQGTGDAEFSPAADCTRGQIVTFLYRNENLK